jgi:hypothetical protein
VDTETKTMGPGQTSMRINSLSTFYLFFGLVCGLFLGTSLGSETSALVSKAVFFLSIAVIAVFGKRIDAALHNSDLEAWHLLRLRNKWYFVLTRYILLRGTSLFILFVFPLVSNVRFSEAIVLALASTIILIIGILTFFGLGEWRNCEQEYAIRLLKSAGEQARIAQN